MKEKAKLVYWIVIDLKSIHSIPSRLKLSLFLSGLIQSFPWQAAHRCILHFDRGADSTSIFGRRHWSLVSPEQMKRYQNIF